MPSSLRITQGHTWRAIFALEQVNGTPIPFAGNAAQMHIRPSLESPTVLMELDSGPNGGLEIQPGGLVGEVHVTASAERTATLPIGSAICDVRVYDTASPNSTVQLGPVTVVVAQAVTR